jgi:hypothetical protein
LVPDGYLIGVLSPLVSLDLMNDAPGAAEHFRHLVKW